MLEQEYRGLDLNGAFISVELWKSQKEVGKKWINQNGEVIKSKARSVSLSNLQRGGIDYMDTFTSTLVASLIRLISNP